MPEVELEQLRLRCCCCCCCCCWSCSVVGPLADQVWTWPPSANRAKSTSCDSIKRRDLRLSIRRISSILLMISIVFCRQKISILKNHVMITNLKKKQTIYLIINMRHKLIINNKALWPAGRHPVKGSTPFLHFCRFIGQMMKRLANGQSTRS